MSLTLPSPPLVHRFRLVLGATSHIYIPYLSVCRFELVALPLLGHVKGSTRVHHLWTRPYFACLVRLILIVFVLGGWCPYSCCFVGCCLQDFFNIARSILFIYIYIYIYIYIFIRNIYIYIFIRNIYIYIYIYKEKSFTNDLHFFLLRRTWFSITLETKVY